MSMNYTTYMTLVAVAAFVVAVLAIFLMPGCSGDASRMGGKPIIGQDVERGQIIDQGKDFCVRYPDDIVCRGPKK